MPVIYKITNPNNKIYIGQSWRYKKRIISYKNSRCFSQKSLYSSIKKYGWDKHKIEIIHSLPEDISQNVLNIYEKFYHEQYLYCGFNTMNIREPGSNGKLHPDSIKKMANSKKGKKLTQEHRNKIAKGNMGRKMSQKTKDIISSIHKGCKRSEEIKQKMRGRKFTDEHKEKLSIIKKKTLEERFGKKKADEIKANMSKSLKGIHMKSIICIETGEIFSSIKEAAHKLNISTSSIDNILSGRAKKTRNNYSFTYNKN